ncbi:MAG: hypothetical protein EOP20_09680, partial [Hyphomicrobiales bacterium]
MIDHVSKKARDSRHEGKQMQELVFDRFHSHLIDRIALRDGLVPHERWHGLPSKYHDGEPESLRRRLVEKYFDQFVDLSPWSGEVDRTLTLLALFPEVSTSARSFHWSDHQLVNNIWDINFPNEWIDQTLWNDAIANAFATLRLSGFGDILQTMAADPSFTFTKLDALEQDWIDDLESSRYNLATISYWARALNKRLMLAFERHSVQWSARRSFASSGGVAPTPPTPVDARRVVRPSSQQMFQSSRSARYQSQNGPSSKR